MCLLSTEKAVTHIGTDCAIFGPEIIRYFCRYITAARAQSCPACLSVIYAASRSMRALLRAINTPVCVCARARSIYAFMLYYMRDSRAAVG